MAEVSLRWRMFNMSASRVHVNAVLPGSIEPFWCDVFGCSRLLVSAALDWGLFTCVGPLYKSKSDHPMGLDPETTVAEEWAPNLLSKYCLFKFHCCQILVVYRVIVIWGHSSLYSKVHRSSPACLRTYLVCLVYGNKRNQPVLLGTLLKENTALRNTQLTSLQYGKLFTDNLCLKFRNFTYCLWLQIDSCQRKH